MTAIKRLLIVVIVAIAMLCVAGCFGQSDRNKAQDVYDKLVIQTNGQIDEVQAWSVMQNQYSMTEPQMKAWLGEYREQIGTLQTDVNATNEAGNKLKTYLTPGSSDYLTMTSNEAKLQQFVTQYVSDYNKNADGYNAHWGAENGTEPLL
jgi:hypothetical protein